MIDPATAALLSPIIAGAAAAAQDRIAEAEKQRKDSAHRAVNYLMAVYEAVSGLEQEADVLVARCQSMDWNSPKDRLEFGKRASDYLGVHEVRSKLSAALAGLRASIPALKKKTDGIKRNKAQRKAVLVEIETKLAAYERYLDELESQENRSGVMAGAIYAAWQRARTVRTTRDAERERAVALDELATANRKRVRHQAMAGEFRSLAVRTADAFR